jgi:NAD-dependent deacetylase
MSQGSVSAVRDDLIAEAGRWIDAAQRVVVLTGAGISTDSDIPDFRGPNGIWTRNPGAERRATLQNYMSDPEVRREAWQTRLGHPGLSAQPNAGHRALVELARRGKLDTLVTQNIDGLHQAAGSDPATVVEVHGTIHSVVCMSCGERAPMERALERVCQRASAPALPACDGEDAQ